MPHPTARRPVFAARSALPALLSAMTLALLAGRARAQERGPESPSSAPPSPALATASTPLPAAASPARPVDARNTSLGFIAGIGYLGINDVNGGALLAGVRLGVGRHFALGFDLGYGLLATTDVGEPQDRWWLMPSVALVIPAGRTRFDLGVGFGLATASGLGSWSAFSRAPFDPEWAFQLVPTGRLHAAVFHPLTERVELFVRLETAMLFGAGTHGFSEGDPNRELRDLSWAALFVGVHYRAW